MNDVQRFRILNFSGYFALATLGTMTVPFLLHKGFTAGEVGILASIFTLSGLISNYVIGYLCDRFGTIKHVYRICALGASILILLLTFVDSKLLFIFTYIVLGFFQSSMMNLNDSWVIEHSAETRQRYGPIRSFGSIGWAVCAFFIGYLIDFTGFYIIGIIYITMMCILLFTSKNVADSPKEPSSLRATDFLQLFQIPRFRFFMLCLFFYGIAHASIVYVPAYLIQSLGGTNGELGIFSFICAGSEIIILIFSMKLLKHFSEEKLFLFAGIALIFRFIMMLFATSLWVVLLSGVLHMFTFGIFLISSRRIMDNLTPAHLKTTGQMLWGAVFAGLGMMIASTVNGFIVQYATIHYSIIFFLTMSLIATFLLIRYNQTIVQEKHIQRVSTL